MKKTGILVVLVFILLLGAGCAGTGDGARPSDQKAAAAAAGRQETGPVYKGKLTGRSNKAKLLTIKVGKGAKATTVSLRFDDQTEGLEHARKGHGIIVAYEKRGNTLFATRIRPKLAKLPAGTSLISVQDVWRLIESDTDFELVDSRPGPRYAAGHLPTAVSIPVCEMQELVSLLPRDKEKLLVFYCGGPT